MDLLRPGDPRQVGSYRVTGRLGEGGMGTVFLGLSPGGRQVAVKLIHPGHASSPQFRERFAREIDAARRVGGFHTASVVDADPAADPPWMVTAYIPGPSLAEAVAASGPFGLNQVCGLGAGLAEGLAAIHACGLVHRDLKPSNVILADDGPRIIDFGIARAAEASPMTTAGMVVGTYSYMSPEQLRGETAKPASDVFALGCTLAFAATGRVTFGEDSIVTVMYRITTEPPDLTDLPNEHGFRELIGACLAKSPDDRPSLPTILTALTEMPAAAAVAATGGPGPGHTSVSAPPAPQPGPQSGPQPGPQYEQTRTMQTGDRSRAEPTRTDTRSGDTGPTAPAGPGGSGRPGARRRALIAAGVIAGLVAIGLGILLSGGSPKSDHLAAAQSSSPPTAHPASQPVSGPPSRPEAALHDPGGKNVFGVVFSSNTGLATGDSNGRTYLWNVATDKLLATLRDPKSNGVNGVAFSPNSNSFATADASGSVYLWNAGTGKLTATLANVSAKGNDSIAFSPDGGFVAVGDGDGSTSLWDVATGHITSAPSASLHDPAGKSVYGIAFSPNGSYIAAGDTNGRSYLWNVATGKLVRTFRDPDSHGLYDVAFSPDGSMLAVSDTATSSGAGVVYLWNVASGKLTATLQSFDDSDFGDIAFSPNGRYLAAASTDGNLNLWNVVTGKLLGRLPGTSGQNLIGVAFSPNGDSVATSDVAGDADVWSTTWLNS
jgi:serine/threonine protein kinase